MKKMNPSVDGYVRKNKKWQLELQKLRTIIVDCGLTEQIKWRNPCYTFQETNVIILGGFKEYCVISFLKGALLKDAKGILLKPGENTQAARVVRFTNIQQIVKIEAVLKAYIHEAIEIEKAGVKFKFKKITEHKVPEELQNKFDETPALKTAFHALTPGRQRAYLMHFSAAKQSETRKSRIEKCMPKILRGEGLDDQYRSNRK